MSLVSDEEIEEVFKKNFRVKFREGCDMVKVMFRLVRRFYVFLLGTV